MDTKMLRSEIEKLPYEQLYHRLNPKTVDALRNNYLPVGLSDAAIKYLCEGHMKVFLNQKLFDDLDDSIKENII